MGCDRLSGNQMNRVIDSPKIIGTDRVHYSETLRIDRPFRLISCNVI